MSEMLLFYFKYLPKKKFFSKKKINSLYNKGYFMAKNSFVTEILLKLIVKHI